MNKRQWMWLTGGLTAVAIGGGVALTHYYLPFPAESPQAIEESWTKIEQAIPLIRAKNPQVFGDALRQISDDYESLTCLIVGRDALEQNKNCDVRNVVIPISFENLPVGTQHAIRDLKSWVSGGGELGTQSCEFEWLPPLSVALKTGRLLGRLLLALAKRSGTAEDFAAVLRLGTMLRKTGHAALFRLGTEYTMRAVNESDLAHVSDRQTLTQYAPLKREADDYLRQRWRCFLKSVHEQAGPFDKNDVETLWLHKVVADRLNQAGVGKTYGDVYQRFHDFAEHEDGSLFRRVRKIYEIVDYENQLMGLDWRQLMKLRDSYRTLMNGVSTNHRKTGSYRAHLDNQRASKTGSKMRPVDETGP